MHADELPRAYQGWGGGEGDGDDFEQVSPFYVCVLACKATSIESISKLQVKSDLTLPLIICSMDPMRWCTKKRHLVNHNLVR